MRSWIGCDVRIRFRFFRVTASRSLQNNELAGSDDDLGVGLPYFRHSADHRVADRLLGGLLEMAVEILCRGDRGVAARITADGVGFLYPCRDRAAKSAGGLV